MKKISIVAVAMLFVLATVFANIVFAQEEQVFLSLTKYDEDISKLPTNVTVITQEEIQNRHVETLGELLENEVGVILKTNGTLGATQSVFMRGATSLQTLVLIDGRRVNSVGMGNANFTNIAAINIERIEIIRGSGAAIYGTSAFGGVINVITKKATEESSLEFNFSFGTFDTYNPSIVIPYTDDKISILVAGSLVNTKGDRENSAFNNTNALLNSTLKLDDTSSLSVSVGIYNSEFGTPGSLSYPSKVGKQIDSNQYVKVDYDVELDIKKINFNAYISQDKRKFTDNDGWSDTENRYTEDVSGFQTDIFVNNIFRFGAEAWQEDYKNNDIITPENSTDKSRQNTAVYAQLNLDLWKFRIIPSARGDRNSAFGNIFTPAISVIFNANEEIKISANTGKVWRAPSFSELYDNFPSWFIAANPDLKPENGLSGDIGIEYSHDKIRLMALSFYTESKNLIQFVTDENFNSTYINLNHTKQYGYEFEAGYIVTSWLSNSVNYTYLKAEDYDTKKVLPYRPEHTLNYTLTVKPIEDLSISAITLYRSIQIVNATSNLESFATLDLSMTYKLNKNISFWMKFFNLGNAKYATNFDYPMPGLSVYSGVSIKLWK